MPVAIARLDKNYPVRPGSGDFEIPIELTFSGSYATGGDDADFRPLTRQAGGRGEVLLVMLPDKNGHNLEYDYTNRKIMVFTTAATQHAASAYAAGITTGTVRGILRGR